MDAPRSDTPVQVLADVRDCARGACIRFTLTLEGVAWPAFAVFTPLGWRAYVDRCRHLPLPLDAGPDGPVSGRGEWLLCSRHNAQYDAATGGCVAGPCVGVSLLALALEARGDALWCLGRAPARA